MNQPADRPGPAGAAPGSGEDRRRSQRVLMRFPVTIHYLADGKTHSVSAHTVSVNDHGALLESPQAFPVGARLDVENIRTYEQMPCRVVRPAAGSSGAFHVPVEFDRAAPNFWHIAFPPHDWKPPE